MLYGFVRAVAIVMAALMSVVVCIGIPAYVFSGAHEYRDRYKFGLKLHDCPISVTYEQFMQYRNLNPEAYQVDEYGVVHYLSGDRTFYLVFKSFSDYMRYVRWEAKEDERKRDIKARKEASDFYSAVLDDVDRVREQTRDEYAKACEQFDSTIAEIWRWQSERITTVPGNTLYKHPDNLTITWSETI